MPGDSHQPEDHLGYCLDYLLLWLSVARHIGRTPQDLLTSTIDSALALLGQQAKPSPESTLLGLGLILSTLIIL